MTFQRSIERILAFAALPLILGLASPAHAHGIGGDADRSILGFVPLGIEHMLLGWDHLLFVAGVVLVAGRAKLAAKLISLFVLGHSTTLITATLVGWRVNPDVVDVVIALSVVFVAGVGILGRPEKFRLFGVAVFVFGLIHGLGLATRFQDLGIPEEGQLWRVIAFNIGIEIGQLAAIAVMAGLAVAAGRIIPPEKRPRAVQLALAPMFTVASMAAGLIALDAFTSPPDPPKAALAADTSCEIISPTESWGLSGGTHPSKAFYAPDEQAPLTDLAHVIGDGYVIVMYADETDALHVSKLREYVESPDGQGVIAAASPDITGVAVFQYRDTMTCDQFEMDSIDTFSQKWLEQVRG